MKVEELEKLVVKTQQELLRAELKAADFAKQFRAAKTKNRRARRVYKRTRQAARRAKELACEAADQASRQQRVFAKARKRLAKAWKKIGLLKSVPKMRSMPRPKLALARQSALARSAKAATVVPQGKQPAPLLPRPSASPTSGAFNGAQPGIVP